MTAGRGRRPRRHPDRRVHAERLLERELVAHRVLREDHPRRTVGGAATAVREEAARRRAKAAPRRPRAAPAAPRSVGGVARARAPRRAAAAPLRRSLPLSRGSRPSRSWAASLAALLPQGEHRAQAAPAGARSFAEPKVRAARRRPMGGRVASSTGGAASMDAARFSREPCRRRTWRRDLERSASAARSHRKIPGARPSCTQKACRDGDGLTQPRQNACSRGGAGARALAACAARRAARAAPVRLDGAALADCRHPRETAAHKHFGQRRERRCAALVRRGARDATAPRIAARGRRERLYCSKRATGASVAAAARLGVHLRSRELALAPPPGRARRPAARRRERAHSSASARARRRRRHRARGVARRRLFGCGMRNGVRGDGGELRHGARRAGTKAAARGGFSTSHAWTTSPTQLPARRRLECRLSPPLPRLSRCSSRLLFLLIAACSAQALKPAGSPKKPGMPGVTPSSKMADLSVLASGARRWCSGTAHGAADEPPCEKATVESTPPEARACACATEGGRPFSHHACCHHLSAPLSPWYDATASARRRKTRREGHAERAQLGGAEGGDAGGEGRAGQEGEGGVQLDVQVAPAPTRPSRADAVCSNAVLKNIYGK